MTQPDNGANHETATTVDDLARQLEPHLREAHLLVGDLEPSIDPATTMRLVAELESIEAVVALASQTQAQTHTLAGAPARAVADGGGEAPSGSPAAEAVASSVPMVVVVDDSSVNRLVTASQLERLGYRTAEFESGQGLLDFMQTSEAAAVLLDWHMPEMDGLETARALRRDEVDAGRTRVPVIALTARAMTGDRQRCIDAGMDDYLSKPASIESMQKALARWVEIPTAASPGLGAPDQAGPASGEADAEAEDGAAVVVDRSTLDALAIDLGSDEIVAQLLTTYLDELDERVDVIVDGLSTGDFDGARRSAHTLKSTSAMFGATALSECCAQIEADVTTTGRIAPDQIESLVPLADTTRRALAASAHVATARIDQTEGNKP